VALFKNLTDDLRWVTHGLPSRVAVKPGEELQVPDEVAQNYGCQPDIWGPLDDAAHAGVEAEAQKVAAVKVAAPANAPEALAPDPEPQPLDDTPSEG
jgi:hypothetical protein